VVPPARGRSPCAASRGLSRRTIAGWAEERIVSNKEGGKPFFAASRRLTLLALLVSAGGLLAPLAWAEAEELVAVVKEQSAADREAKLVQERIDQLDDETGKLLGQYRQLLSETESFTAYSAQLGTQVQSQLSEIENTNQELAEIETTTREVMPLMQKMLDTLGRFVELDVPFLLEERSKRVATLKDMMARADVSVSEKYRRIVEAYVVEMEYGRTIEAYEGKLAGTDERTVQLLRVGRVSLLYQTMDGKETGYWDTDKKAWVVDNHYAHAFREGTYVAKKLGAPDILFAPVPAPKEDS
jgi:hypothetical protein